MVGERKKTHLQEMVSQTASPPLKNRQKIHWIETHSTHESQYVNENWQ